MSNQIDQPYKAMMINNAITPIIKTGQINQNIELISYSNLLIISIETVKNINGSFYAIAKCLFNDIHNTFLIHTEELFQHYPELLLNYYESRIKFN